MKFSRDTWIATAVLAVLILATIGAGIQQSRRQEPPPYLSSSSAPDGAQALKLWLRELGYGTLDERLGVFVPPDGARVIFALEPAFVADEEIAALDRWVNHGGTLVVAGSGIGARQIAGYYDIRMSFPGTPPTASAPSNPLMRFPPLKDLPSIRPEVVLETGRDDMLVSFSSGGQPLLVSFQQGLGRVVVSASAYPFSNLGLKDTGNPGLALNILASIGARGPVWFDDWHHGLRGGTGEIIGPGMWLRFTPAGRAILFVIVATFLGLLLQGRSFGRPVPLPHEIRRRGPLEHITAIGNLGRRAGHRPEVMQQYHARIKRALGKRYRLDPTLPDEEYVAALGQFDPQLDELALLDLLKGLKDPRIAETEMVRLADQAASWLKNA